MTWKVSSKTTAFKKARHQFKRTLLRRKMERQSLSAIEQAPTLRTRFLPQHKESESAPTPHSATMMSFDDLAPSQTLQSAVEKESALRKAFRGPRKSKGTEQLMDLVAHSKAVNSTLHLITEE